MKAYDLVLRDFLFYCGLRQRLLNNFVALQNINGKTGEVGRRLVKICLDYKFCLRTGGFLFYFDFGYFIDTYEKRGDRI